MSTFVELLDMEVENGKKFGKMSLYDTAQYIERSKKRIAHLEQKVKELEDTLANANSEVVNLRALAKGLERDKGELEAIVNTCPHFRNWGECSPTCIAKAKEAHEKINP